MRFRPPSGARTEPPPADDAAAWITGAIPDGWFTEPPEVVVDRDEIIIWGRLPEPRAGRRRHRRRQGRRPGRPDQPVPGGHPRRPDPGAPGRSSTATSARSAWGVRCGDTEELFTHLSAPVMTRLRQPERQVLDTLVDAGVARVPLRGAGLVRHAWSASTPRSGSTDLRDAMTKVDELRRRGPTTV